MKNIHEKLEKTIKLLRSSFPELPKKDFEVLEEAKAELEKFAKKKRCKHCDRHEHYDETLGIWKCNECDKHKPCPVCTAETTYDEDLGVWKCNECEWNGHY